MGRSQLWAVGLVTDVHLEAGAQVGRRVEVREGPVDVHDSASFGAGGEEGRARKSIGDIHMLFCKARSMQVVVD